MIIGNEENIKNIENNNEDICAICMDNNSAGKLTTTRCGHKFHVNCILRWLIGEIQDNCPYCRQDLYGFIFNINNNLDELTNQLNGNNNRYLNDCNDDCNNYYYDGKLNYNEVTGNVILYISPLNKSDNETSSCNCSCNCKCNCITIERKELCKQLINVKQPYYWCNTEQNITPMYQIKIGNNKYIISAFLRTILLFSLVEKIYINEYIDSLGVIKYLDIGQSSIFEVNLLKNNLDICSKSYKIIYKWSMELLQDLSNSNNIFGYLHAIIYDLFHIVVLEFNMESQIAKYQTIICSALYVACKICKLNLTYQGETLGVSRLVWYTDNTADAGEMQKYIDFLENYLKETKSGTADKLKLWIRGHGGSV